MARAGEELIIKARRGIFYGWWLLAAAFVVVAFGGGSYFFGFSVFFNAIIAETGWSRALTAGAFSLASLEGGLEGLVLGPLVDKYGARRIMFFGMTLLGLGFIALSFVHSIFFFYLVYMVFLGIGANAVNGIAPLAAVANWFNRRRTIAFGILSGGYSVGGGVMVPLLGLLVTAFGWRKAAAFAGVTMFLIGTPLISMIRHRPEQYGYLPDGDQPDPTKEAASGVERHSLEDLEAPRIGRGGALPERDLTLREALKTRAWWMLALAFGLRNLSLSAVIAHQVPLLTSRGFDPQTAANVLGLVAITGLPGRLIFGLIGDMLPKRALLITAFILQAIGLVLLTTSTSIFQIYVYTVFMGLSWGSVPILFSLRVEYFGRTNFAAISGFMQAVVTPFGVSGPFFAGLIYDITESYDLAFVVFIVACLLAMVFAGLAAPPKVPQRAKTEGAAAETS